MIVDCAVYEDGRRRAGDLALEHAFDAGREDGCFVWIGLHEPSEAEFDAIRHEFDLHELAVEDAIKAHQRPKLEVYGHTVFLVLRPARIAGTDEPELELGELLVFMGEGFVISVRHGRVAPLDGVRAAIESRPDLLRCGEGAVVHTIVDHVVDGYVPVLDWLEEETESVEEEVFSRARTNPVERIYDLKRDAIELHRALGPLAVPMDRLARGELAAIPDQIRAYFRDVYDHVVRAVERVETVRELLTSVLEANLTQVSVRQNEDMRRISAWVAIVAVPTLVAGIYGMNFEHMPELEWELGYPLALLLMLTVCSVLYRAFKRAGWL